MDIGYKLKEENPQKNANLFSKLIFGWLVPLIKKGTRRRLKIIDLYKALDKDKSQHLADTLEKHWQTEVLEAKRKKSKPSLMNAITKTFIVEFMIYGIFYFFSNAVLLCLKPIFLQELIAQFTDNPSKRSNEMYIYSGALVCVSLLIVFFYHHNSFGLQVIGMRIRIATSSLVYRKITRLNQRALGEVATGQVVNLLSNDVNRFDQVIQYLHVLWVLPFQTGFLLFLIWQQVGLSALPGVISMAIISLPIQGYLAKIIGSLRLSISKKTDTRAKLMGEVISGIQVIKMYTWEKPFEKMVLHARDAEIKDITSASYLRGVFASCMVFLDRLSLFITVICFVLLGNQISADMVFSLAQAYNILQTTVASWYPLAISYGAESWVSVKRLQDFLVMEEKEQAAIERTEKNSVTLSDVNASWTATTNTLQDFTVQIPQGTLCAVVGPVGAGKTSLLQLLLGELPANSGTVQMGENVSYSSQEPWLFPSTVRNNILFGQPYDKRWYNKVVKVCALEKDFEQFPKGDQTIAGEKGASFSGGQRARINLARAVYKKADIYLLDDPLSAVDTHVGKHLFEECIERHLKDKTRILVTHQLQYLKKAGLIIVINNGKIEAKGTFAELSNSDLDFAKMLTKSDETKEQQEDDFEYEQNQTNFIRAPSNMSSRKKSSIYGDISEKILENEEEETSGNESNNKTLMKYLLAINNLSFLLFLLVLLILAQGFNAGSDYWIAFWTDQEQIRNANQPISTFTHKIDISPLNISNMMNLANTTVYTIENNRTVLSENLSSDIFDYFQIDGETRELVKTNYAMGIYGILIIFAIVLTLIRSSLFFKACMTSSTNLHNSLFHTLLKVPMRFFDSNPSGRILNRFSKDLGAIDEILPRMLLEALQVVLVMAGVLVNITVTNPYVLIPLVIMGVIFTKIISWYMSTAKVLKHLEGMVKSPVFSHVNSTLNGIVTIRASEAEEVLIEEFDDHQDIHTSAWYLSVASMSTFGLWLDILSVVFLACVTFSFVIFNNYININGSLVGLAISQCLVLTGMVQYGMRHSAEVVNQLTSVERVLEYTSLETEGPFDTPEENKLVDRNWPKSGHLEFRNTFLKYIEGDPPTLKNLNFTIKPGEKVGIVGRTGAGKSSLIAALFRLATVEGSIRIDGVDTKTVGLTDLRKKISIIPQEPILFSATLRYNLDPFNEYEDDKIWDALEQVKLKASVNSLDFMVAEGGANFSVGQRQLVCLARAALRDNNILVLDEATANVDPRTDSLIQQTLRRRFKDCTVLTIAHRLNTIMDSDKVLVMSFGSLVECAHPYELLQIPDGHFYKMVKDTDASMFTQLTEAASAAYRSKKHEDVDNNDVVVSKL